MLYFNNKSKITNIVKSSQSRGEEREKKKEKGEKKNDIGEGLIYKFLLEVKREKKQNDAESVIQFVKIYI